MFAIDRLETFEDTAEENSNEANEKPAAITASAMSRAALLFGSEPLSRKLNDPGLT